MHIRGIRLLAGSDAPVDRVDPKYGALLAHHQTGTHHLDYSISMEMLGRGNWDFYGWANGAAPELL